MIQKQYQVFFAFLLFLSSCAVTLPGGSSSSSGSTASVPIYQGMTVGSLSDSNNLQSPRSQGVINQDNPFGLPNNEMIEHRIESDLANLLEEETMDYYALPSEVVRITINILNPQSYVILSFNLNGRRYQSFEFREGSTSTRLLMDVSLQNSPGIQSLTIDEIKYIVDSGGDNQIRDVVMFGDRTVEVGIGYNQLPIVNMVSQTILPTTVNYEIEVTDSLNMLSTQETAIYFYFFDGETLQKEVLIVGNNELEFNKLTSKTLYQYALVSALNPLDGEGPVLTYHNQEAFLTSNFIQLSVNSTKESISYEVSVMNGLESGVINRVEIEKNSEIINTQENSIGSFVELLSNNEYALNVYYDYSHEGETELFTEVYSLTASTLAKLTPTFSFTDVVAGKEDVTFEYEVTDLDEVGSLAKVELFKGEEVVETLTEFEDTSFANLLSNNDYQLKATYTYDLNDGVGEQSIVITNQTKTLPKEAPEFLFSNLIPSKESISFNFQVTDLDQVGSLVKIELIKGDVILETFTSFDSLFLEGLLSNNQYLLKAYYEVDLNDGSGLQTLVFNQDFTTLPKSTPTFSFTDVVAGKEDVTFEYEVTDLDEVGVLSKIELFKGEEVVETLTEFEDTSFANLLSNNDYQLKATYTYDLNDGVGEQFLVFERNSKTLAMSNPSFIFTDVNPGKEDIIFEYEVIDEDEVGSLTKIELINLGEVVETLTEFDDTSFTELLSNNEYTLKATYNYDLNDGIGNEALIVISETKTDFKLPPEFDESLIILSKTSIDLQSSIIDIDNTGLIKTLKIYKDEVMISDISDSNTFSFINLEKNTSYRIYVEYEYDLNDGDTKKIISLDKLVKTKFLEFGSGTDIDPYVIKSVEDLSDIKFGLAAVYKLANDLNLEGINWTPIAPDFYSSFSGKFDGQGFTINNLTIKGTYNLAGLFGSTSMSLIKNLNLSNVDIDVTGSIDGDIYVGSFIAYNSGFVENLHALSGTIIGRKRADKKGYFGGLIGIHSTPTIYQNTSLSDFSNYLEVTGVGNSNSSTGGIFGRVINNVWVDNSFNYGSVSGENYVGGFIGEGNGISITNSENSGNINGQSYVGGMIGNGNSPRITNSTNSGNVNGQSYVGGMIGNGNSPSIIDSMNSGFVFGSYGVGGLIGNGNPSITNSINSGSVSGQDNVGGLIGYGYYTINIINSINLGNVAGSSRRVGGLIGSGDSTTITNSMNKGNISGFTRVGGLIGYGDSTTISKSMNIGSVSGENRVGGLIGDIGENLSTNLFVYYSINFGHVSTPTMGTDIGGIAGRLASQNDFEHAYHYAIITGNGVEVTGNNFGIKVTDSSTLNLEFFSTTLEWYTEVWDFNQLDVAIGVYPTLKNLPNI